MVVGLSKDASFVHVATTMPILGSGLLAPNSMAPAGSGSAQFQVMSSPVSSRLRFLLGEDALECLVAGPAEPGGADLPGLAGGRGRPRPGRPAIRGWGSGRGSRRSRRGAGRRE